MTGRCGLKEMNKTFVEVCARLTFLVVSWPEIAQHHKLPYVLLRSEQEAGPTQRDPQLEFNNNAECRANRC